jgi:hypothetical protein
MKMHTPWLPVLSAAAMVTVIGTAAALRLAYAGPPAVGLDVKPGLWEITTTTALQGSMIPPAQLERMSPEQRARIAAMMAKRAAAGPKSFVRKSCVTAQELQRGAFRAGDDQDDANCKHAVVRQTATAQEMTMVCTGDSAHSANMRIEAVDRDHIKGVISVRSEGGKSAMQLAGRWLGASCAGAEDD